MPDPGHQQVHNALLLGLREGHPRRNPVPLLKTAPAAAGAGVLGHKDGMAPHGGLLSVIGNLSGSQTPGNEILGVPTDHRQTLFPDIFPVLFAEMKPGPECGFLQPLQRFANGHTAPLLCLL